jgi:hypothetical protein
VNIPAGAPQTAMLSTRIPFATSKSITEGTWTRRGRVLGAVLILPLTQSSALNAQQATTARAAVDQRGLDYSALVTRVATVLEQRYVIPDRGRSMAEALRARVAEGAFRSVETPHALADSLTAQLRSWSGDRHLRLTARGATPANSVRAEEMSPARHSEDGVEEAKRLDGNVGYLRLSYFADVGAAGKHIAQVMQDLATTDALIIDVRGNTGGAPETVMYLVGYFFAARTLVARVYARPDERTTEMWSAKVSGPTYADKPIYVLTNRRTFSAGEAVAYHLQAFGRAVIVGDTTGGGAHRVSRVPLDGELTLSVPETRVTNVRTQTDWEGRGVIPDVAVSSELAAETAHLAALKALPRTLERDRAILRLEQRGLP